MKENKRNRGKCNKFQRKGVNNLDASKDSCCAWMSAHTLLAHKVFKTRDNEICGLKNVGRSDMRPACCLHERADSIGDCDSFSWPKGPAFDWVLKAAKDENEFYK